jgi:hypothetical protein
MKRKEKASRRACAASSSCSAMTPVRKKKMEKPAKPM